MIGKVKTKYVCQNCGYSTPRWTGKCPECGNWNTFVEEIIETDKRKLSKTSSIKSKSAELKNISEVINSNETRFKTGIDELDRVLGGGIVNGSVILIGGDPGIGKSTLMLQIADKLDGKKILYVSADKTSL
jgi:DNA repair protein RadA/Sms